MILNVACVFFFSLLFLSYYNLSVLLCIVCKKRRVMYHHLGLHGESGCQGHPLVHQYSSFLMAADVPDLSPFSCLFFYFLFSSTGIVNGNIRMIDSLFGNGDLGLGLVANIIFGLVLHSNFGRVSIEPIDFYRT